MTNRKKVRASKRSRQGGQAIVLIALSMVALLAFMVLAIDGGRYYDQRRTAQNAADVASLAGLYQYQHGGTANKNTDVLKAIQGSVEINGIADSNGTSNDGVNSNVQAFWINSSGLGVDSGGTTYADPTSCTSASQCLIDNSSTAKPTNATGIKVRAIIPYTSFVGQMVGQRNLQAQADGVALISAGTTTYSQGANAAVWAGGGACGTSGNPAFIVGSKNSNNTNLGDLFINGGLNNLDGQQQNWSVGNVTVVGGTDGSGGTGNTISGVSGTYSQGSTYAPSTNFPDYFYFSAGSLGTDSSNNPLPPSTMQMQASMFKPDDRDTTNADYPGHFWNGTAWTSQPGFSGSALPDDAVTSGNYLYQFYVSGAASGAAPSHFYHYIKDSGNEDADLSYMIAHGARGVFYIDGDWNIGTNTTAGTGTTSGITVIVSGKVTASNNQDLGNAGTWGYNISVLAGGMPTSGHACAEDDETYAIFNQSGNQLTWDGFLYVPNGMAVLSGNNHHQAHGPVIAYSFVIAPGNPNHPANNFDISSCPSCFSRPSFMMGLQQ